LKVQEHGRSSHPGVAFLDTSESRLPHGRLQQREENCDRAARVWNELKVTSAVYPKTVEQAGTVGHQQRYELLGQGIPGHVGCDASATPCNRNPRRLHER